MLAALLPALVFAARYANNSDAAVFSTLNTLLCGGMSALGYVLIDELAIPLGLYIARNFGGVVCSTSRQRQRGTGRGYGPAGGLLGTFTLILGSVSILTWDRWRGLIKLHQMLVQPPAWAGGGGA
jgi:hypothetical protein